MPGKQIHERMIDWNAFIMGLIALTLGLLGLTFMSDLKKDERRSLTGVYVIFSTYTLLGLAIISLIRAFLQG